MNRVAKRNLEDRVRRMKKRNLISILLYLLGVILFVISNSSGVGGSPINLEYFQRIILCSAAVGSIAIAPFVYKTKTAIGIIIKFVIAAMLIYCIFIFGGFRDHAIASTMNLLR